MTEILLKHRGITDSTEAGPEVKPRIDADEHRGERGQAPERALSPAARTGEKPSPGLRPGSEYLKSAGLLLGFLHRCAREDAVHAGAAIRAGALHCLPAGLHLHFLGITHFLLTLALYAVSLHVSSFRSRFRRSLTFLRPIMAKMAQFIAESRAKSMGSCGIGVPSWKHQDHSATRAATK